MYCYDDIINHIKKTKDNLLNKAYTSGKNLEKDFYEINELTGVKTNDIQYKNLKDIFKVHQFFIDEVCKIHDSENDCFNEELFKKHINVKNLNDEIKDAKRAYNIYFFNNSGYDYFLIGDLHSDTISLKRILLICDFFNKIVENKKIRLVFLGDYVDRGKAHLKILEYILALKFLFPQSIYLLKGNHDDGIMLEDGVKLCVRKPEDESEEDYFLLYLRNLAKNAGLEENEIINSYLKFFHSLCNIAFINNENITLLAVHGGIPRPRKDSLKYYGYISTLSDLTNNDIKDHINKTITNNMIWSDPCDDESDLKENNGRFRFNIDHFNEFQAVINFDLLIRGHEAEIEGFKKFFDDRLFTLFSSGAVVENNTNINNETAYETITPKFIHFKKDGKVSLVSLV